MVQSSMVNIRKNNEWLYNNNNQYIGKWVAICDGELIAVSNDMLKLSQELGNNNSILITYCYDRYDIKNKIN